MDRHICDGLRVEHLEAPLGLGAERPRFSWRMETNDVGSWQAGYELEVAEAETGSVVWASGQRNESDSVLVAYEGAALRSNTAYTWRVRTWSSASAAPSEWASSRFETGLMRRSDWSAHWVEPEQVPAGVERWTMVDWIAGRRPEGEPAQRLRPTRLLRQSFDLALPVLRARLYATARGIYEAHVNGRAADDQVLAPGFDSYAHRTSVQCYDVTGLLRTGPNALGFALADGWWAGRIGLTGSSAQWGARIAALWQLEIEHVDGSHTTVASDATVRSTRGPHDYADLFVGERLDRRAVIDGWNEPGLDDSRWRPVRVLDEDLENLTPFHGEPVRRVLELAPVRISGDVDSGFLVDFGQVVAGRVRLTMPQLAPGTTVTIEHTEALAADGSWFVNIDGINKEQTDVYVAAGLAGGERYEPSFTFHGFRYARVHGLPAAPSPADIRAVVLSSDLEPAGDFTTSDERLNRLHRNTVWSQRGNFLSIPTDCPQRERAGWSGDIQVFAPAAANNANVAAFLTRWLRNLRADQLPDGAVPIYSPRSPFDADQAATGEGLGAIVAAPGWGDAIAIVPWVLYERYADAGVLAENYDAMLAWIDHQARTAAAGIPARLDRGSMDARTRENHSLLFNTGENFGDWLTPSTLRGRPLHEAIGIAPRLTGEIVGPMFQIRTLDLVSRIAAVLGRDDDAARFSGRARRLRQAFAEEYITEDGRLGCDLQGPHVLALAFDLVPEDRRALAAAHLAHLVRANGDRLDTGFLSVPHLLDVLQDTGYGDLAQRVLWQSEEPSWLYEVDQGATTIWESWDAVAPDGTPRAVSMNHYAFGCVDDWLYRRVAGISPLSAGYREFLVEPDFTSGLSHVQASINSPYGRIEIAWTLAEGTTNEGTADEGTATVELTVPPNTRATLRLDGVEETLPNGFHVRRTNPARIASHAGLRAHPAP
ncbi:glycoside hydrolase family 78 protein [Arthrobacter ginkgonis]|uniref:alpha-L-rhamnosidase n=1 Tax=Arthrobacter ginkgonis TaxID=1630594 RepID=A0ABP7C5Z3_9MICC